MPKDFNGFGLPAKLNQALARMNFSIPTPIQAQAIPLALKGKDILGSAQTGTGKTGAFGIPLIAKLLEDSEAAALVMTPTRELAAQVIAALQQMIPTPDIKTALLIGGEAMPRQLRQLDHKPRLIVGTPGRINDHLDRGSLKLNNVRVLVLDETDRMLDMGFGIQIERILRHVPDERQTMLFSATLPSNIVKLSGKYMKDPVRIAAGSTISPAAKIKQELIHVTDSDKYTKLVEQLEERKGSVIIFVKTKHGTEKLADKLNKASHRADAIHGDLQQRRRDRVIQGFRDKKFRILVATDVAARGLDIPHIAHVINYDLPQCPEDYIHRIGRTARAGAEGEAVNLLTPADSAKWRAIHRLMNGEEAGPAPRGPSRKPQRKPFWKKEGGERSFGDKPRGERSYADRPRSEHARSDRPRSEHPRSESARGDRPHSDRTRSDSARNDNPRSERVYSDRPRTEHPRSDRPKSDRPLGDRRPSDKPHGERAAHSERSRGERSGGERSFGDKARSGKPYNRKPSRSA